MAARGYFAWRCKARNQHMYHVSNSSRARDYFPPRAAIAGPDRLPQNVASQEGRLRGPFRTESRRYDPRALTTLANHIGPDRPPA